MKLIAAFLSFFFLISCEPLEHSLKSSQHIRPKRKYRTPGTVKRAPRTHAKEKEEVTEKQADFTFPIAAVSQNTNLNIQASEDQLSLIISSDPTDQALNILSGFEGKFEKDSDKPNVFYFKSETYTFTFEVSKSDTQFKLSNEEDKVKAGEILAETTGEVAFSLQENGKPVAFCLNVIDKINNLIQITTSHNPDNCN